MWEMCQAVWKGPLAVRWHANNPSEIALSLPCHPCNRLIQGWGGGQVEAGLEWRLEGAGEEREGRTHGWACPPLGAPLGSTLTAYFTEEETEPLVSYFGRFLGWP